MGGRYEHMLQPKTFGKMNTGYEKIRLEFDNGIIPDQGAVLFNNKDIVILYVPGAYGQFAGPDIER